MPLGALEWTRTTTPLMAQALNLLRIPFRHEGIRVDYGEYNTLALRLCQQFLSSFFGQLTIQVQGVHRRREVAATVMQVGVIACQESTLRAMSE